MNILPQDLKGKRIVDCYECDINKLLIEFEDGTKIKLNFNGYHTIKGGKEPELELIQE